MTELLRERDEPIGGNESLFRSVAQVDVANGALRETAIDLQGHSVYRQKFCPTPLEALKISQAAGRNGHTGIASVCPDDLPPSVVLAANSIEFEAFAVDEPDIHVAHAEVRVRRVSDRPTRQCCKPGGTAAKLELRLLIAKKFKVVIAP